MNWVRLTVCCAGIVVFADAAERRWPLFAGSLAGELSPLGEDGPRLSWTLEARAPEATRRTFALTIEGDAASGRGQLSVDLPTGVTTWILEDVELETGAWFGAVASRLGDVLGGAAASGRLKVSGRGTLDDGRPEGTLQVQWQAGTLRHEVADWELGGIEAEGEFDLDGVGDMTVSVRSLRYGVWALQEGQLQVHLGAGLQAGITRLQVRGFGGEINLDPFALALSQPEAAVKIHLSGIAMEQVVAMLPKALAEARGRLDGELAAQWSAASGLQLGAGWLGLTDGSEASVRLTPVPGLITAQIPENNPAYAPLQRVELGRTALNVSLLRVVFTPLGDAQGRTATLRLHAEPVDPQLKAPLIIDVNVAGPLDELLKLGFDSRVSF